MASRSSKSSSAWSTAATTGAGTGAAAGAAAAGSCLLAHFSAALVVSAAAAPGSGSGASDSCMRMRGRGAARLMAGVRGAMPPDRKAASLPTTASRHAARSRSVGMSRSRSFFT
eukprot:scaffold25828_cov48-Phaeocystis_antarctica.AAC.2